MCKEGADGVRGRIGGKTHHMRLKTVSAYALKEGCKCRSFCGERIEVKGGRRELIEPFYNEGVRLNKLECAVEDRKFARRPRGEAVGYGSKEYRFVLDTLHATAAVEAAHHLRGYPHGIVGRP